MKTILQYLAACATIVSLVAFVYYGIAAQSSLDPRRRRNKFLAFFTKLGPEDFVGYGFTMYLNQSLSAGAALLSMAIWAATLDR